VLLTLLFELLVALESLCWMPATRAQRLINAWQVLTYPLLSKTS